MRYYWYFDANKFTVVDETGEEIASTVPVTVKYQQRAVDPIKSIEDMGVPKLYGINDDSLVLDLHEVYCVATEDIALAGPPAGRKISAWDTIYINKASQICIASDNKNNTQSWNSVNVVLTEKQQGKEILMKVEDIWDYQDDGYDSDVQLTATYYAASMLADMVPEGGQLVKSLFDRYRYRFKDLQIKHNSARYTGITIKPNQF